MPLSALAVSTFIEFLSKFGLYPSHVTPDLGDERLLVRCGTIKCVISVREDLKGIWVAENL
jgi:hypothetical protein